MSEIIATNSLYWGTESFMEIGPSTLCSVILHTIFKHNVFVLYDKLHLREYDFLLQGFDITMNSVFSVCQVLNLGPVNDALLI